MIFSIIRSGALTGAMNMKLDSLLAARCKPDEFYLRLYRWQPYCISLGMYQEKESVNWNKAAEDGLDIVVRPTGGRAVLHAEELTYAIICHSNHSFTPQTIYKEVNVALQKGLALYNPKLSSSSLESLQPNFRELYKADGGFACFAVSARNELKFDHRKIVGSAQRKIGDVVLQHGSILCGTFHKKIIDYLIIPEHQREATVQNIENKTTEIETVTGVVTDYHKLEFSIRNGFEQHFNEEKKFVELEGFLPGSLEE
ncbi:MAG: lipoate--protein ligase family protein [Ignavibacteria bacterium]|nr:lipoate--protein ligase family protein [Ignavibacteria bacterium]